MDTNILEDLGLTNAEIKVYIALLELGNSTAGPILKKTNLQNSVVHRALHSLTEKALIGSIFKGKRRIYQATDPKNFYNFIENKKQRFEQILTELEKKRDSAKTKQEAVVFEGKKGINEIYRTILESGGKEYNTFGGGKRVTFDIMGETWWKNFHIKRIAKKIPSRQIFDETIRDFGKELNKLPITEIKFLSQEFEQLTETIICGEYVAIAIFTENPYGLLIKDKTVVEGYKKQFELMWKIAKN